MKTKTIDIVAREWFDSYNGNSYFSAYITVNYSMESEANFYLPFQYGYGDQYLYMAKDVLIKHGYISDFNYSQALWRYSQDNNIILRSQKIENCKKSSL